MHLHDFSEYVSDFINTNKCWAPFETEVITEIFNDIKEPTMFVDIGANLGYFSLLAASKGIPTVAFEPVKENYELFSKSIKDNKYDIINLHKLALGNARGKVTINLSKTNMGACSVRLMNIDDKSEECKMDTFDSFFSEESSHALIVKIDAEHMEKDIVTGMVETLKKGTIRCVIIEISVNRDEILDIFQKCGYTQLIDVGFDGDKVSVNPKTEYLTNDIYFTTVERYKKACNIFTTNDQKMLLLYKDIPLIRNGNHGNDVNDNSK